MTKSKKGLLKPKFTVRVKGKPDEDIPIDGDSVLGGLHDIAKWVVDTTSDDQKETEEEKKS
jgi:hypothetical protein